MTLSVGAASACSKRPDKSASHPQNLVVQRAAILLAVVGIVMSNDAANSTGLTWVRTTLSLAARLLGYIAVGAVVEMNILIHRLVSQPTWTGAPLDNIDHLIVGVLSVGSAIGAVTVLASAIA